MINITRYILVWIDKRVGNFLVRVDSKWQTQVKLHFEHKLNNLLTLLTVLMLLCYINNPYNKNIFHKWLVRKNKLVIYLLGRILLAFFCLPILEALNVLKIHDAFLEKVWNAFNWRSWPFELNFEKIEVMKVRKKRKIRKKTFICFNTYFFKEIDCLWNIHNKVLSYKLMHCAVLRNFVDFNRERKIEIVVKIMK